MAPIKSTKGGKGKPAGGAKKSTKSSKPTDSGISKKKQKSMALAKPGGAQKTKSKDANKKKKKRVYTEAELDIPKLNGIIPAGIAKSKGVKKGKKFVDDQASMMAIMSVVNAEKEGQVEGKIQKQRQLEEIREAKRLEAEKRGEEKKARFEDKKDELRKKKRRKSHGGENVEAEPPASTKLKKKRVSFG